MAAPREGNLAQWVSEQQKQHTGSNVDTIHVGVSSADQLEQEMNRARQERLKRRSHISGASPQVSGAAAPVPVQHEPKASGEDTLRKLLGERGLASPQREQQDTTNSAARSNTLLDRYGGAMGPTGVARPGTQDSPVSLASFMGGKAGGPRLGKLAGDGRNAPPEAELIHSSRRALPGLSHSHTGKSAPLASFLEARASGKDDSMEINVPRNPALASSRPLSPINPPNSEQPSTTVKPLHEENSLTNASTSPMKDEQVKDAKVLTPSHPPAHLESAVGRHNALSPGSIIHSPISDAMATFPPRAQRDNSTTDPEISPAFGATLRQGEKLPTESLSRLRSQRMVEHRVREAQEHSEAEEKRHKSPPSRPSIPTETYFEAPKATERPQSPLKRRELDRQVRSPPSEAQTPNALPGMLSPGGAPQRNLYAVNRKRSDDDQRDSAPVRLPGMGGAQAPFPSASANKNHADLSLNTSMSESQEREAGPSSASKIADSTAALEALLEGRNVKTPPKDTVSLPPVQNSYARHSGTLKIAKNKIFSKTDSSAVLQGFNDGGGDVEITSIEIVNISPSGNEEKLSKEEGAILYETETHVVTLRIKDPYRGGRTQTKVYAHVGRQSKVVKGGSSNEAKKIMDIAKQHGVIPIDARQGRESRELVEALGSVLVTREGSRRNFDAGATCMYLVRGQPGAHFIDQVDFVSNSHGRRIFLTLSVCTKLSSSLYSAASAIVFMMNDVFVWHGIGATTDLRATASRYASQQQGKPAKFTEYEEGAEDELFWTCFERGIPSANAWHHRHVPRLPPQERTSRFFTLSDGAGKQKHYTEQIPFSALDIKRDRIHILQLPMEIYVLIGPDARSQRHDISSAIETATTLSKAVARSRGLFQMVPPIHVVVFPTLVPLEVRAAFRYWHDEHLNGERWQRLQLCMNVWERKQALEQLSRDEYPLQELDNDLFLPVGIGLADIKGIDI